MEIFRKDKNLDKVSIIHKLRAWLRKVSTLNDAKSKKRQAENELKHLSPHMRRDLGFDSSVRPLHWSTYSPQGADKSRDVSACISH